MTGDIVLTMFYDFAKRSKYYLKAYSTLPNVIDVVGSTTDTKVDLALYNKWIKEYDRVKSSVTKRSLTDIVTKIIDDMTGADIKHKFIELNELTKYQTPLRYMCNEANYSELFNDLQLTLLERIQNVLKNQIQVLFRDPN
jgi:hypothetical protein